MVGKCYFATVPKHVHWGMAGSQDLTFQQYIVHRSWYGVYGMHGIPSFAASQPGSLTGPPTRLGRYAKEIRPSSSFDMNRSSDAETWSNTWLCKTG